MTPSQIITAIKEALQDSSYLSYIPDEAIFVGVRESIALFPCILLEYVGDRVTRETYPYEMRTLSINLTCYIQVHDKDLQIVGDTSTKGAADVENDIRKALSSDYTLGLNDVMDTKIPTSVHDFEQYPIRGFAINIEVNYRQNRLTRA